MPNPVYYKVDWSFNAQEDLADIYEYIEIDSAKAANRVIDVLLELGDSLTLLPHRFPIEPLLKDAPLEFRFVPKWRYKIIYHINEENQRVIISRIFNLVLLNND